MIQILTDHMTIYSILEKENVLPSSFDKDFIQLITSGNEYFLVVFHAASGNFKAFECSLNIQNSEVIQELMMEVQEVLEIAGWHSLQNDCMKFISSEIVLKQNSRYFYDAH
jgi:hypothetical protein